MPVLDDAPFEVALGELQRIPCEFIESKSKSNAVLVKSLARSLSTTKRNVLPVIVKPLSDDHYEAVFNNLILEAAKYAELEFVLCIPVDASMQSQVASELGQAIQVDLTTASEQDLIETLKYIQVQPGSPLKTVDVTIAASRIAAEDRSTWQDFSPITRLQCGITRGKKLEALATVFYLSPTPPPPPPNSISLNQASQAEILERLSYLRNQPGGPLKTVDATIAASKIAAADRSTWQDFTPITKLGCGITKGKKLDALSSVFYLTPPPPPPEPPASISLKQASKAEIFERLDYLTTYKIGGFDVIDPEAVSDLIASVDRSKWKSLTPVTRLNCGIDTAKVKTLKTLFSL